MANPKELEINIPKTLEVLRELVRTSNPDHFEVVMTIFLYVLSSDAGFQALGQQSHDDPEIDQAVAQVLNKSVSVVKTYVVSLQPDPAFIYGAVDVGGDTGTLIYFPAITRGLLDIAGAGNTSDGDGADITRFRKTTPMTQFIAAHKAANNANGGDPPK